MKSDEVVKASLECELVLDEKEKNGIRSSRALDLPADSMLLHLPVGTLLAVEDVVGV